LLLFVVTLLFVVVVVVPVVPVCSFRCCCLLFVVALCYCCRCSTLLLFDCYVPVYSFVALLLLVGCSRTLPLRLLLVVVARCYVCYVDLLIWLFVVAPRYCCSLFVHVVRLFTPFAFTLLRFDSVVHVC
jgi:hypothetical protein